MIFLVAIAVLVSQATAACPAGSVQGLSPEACYKVYTDATDRDHAEELCHEKDGGHLASLGSAFENSFLRGLLAKTAATDRFWIGGSGYTGDGRACRRVSWQWSDESEWNYLNWAQGSPSCPSDTLNCVSFDASTGRWHDEVCTAKKPFVCLIEDNSQASHCADEWTYNDATKLCYY
ncbi:Protein CLEC-51, partial [Aphelenchoides avenae]